MNTYKSFSSHRFPLLRKSFGALVKIKNFRISALFTVVLMSLPMRLYSQDPFKIVDVSNQTTDVPQDYDFWCVYACLEAVSNNDKCVNCANYLGDYISKYDTNPYPTVIMSDLSFDNAMSDFMSSSSAPCIDGSEYSQFGVFQSDLINFIGHRTYYLDFVAAISDPNTDFFPAPIFSVSTSSGTGHCVLFVSSVVYDQDIYDSKSSVTIMDPDVGQKVTMSCDDFFGEYTNYYYQY